MKEFSKLIQVLKILLLKTKYILISDASSPLFMHDQP